MNAARIRPSRPQAVDDSRTNTLRYLADESTFFEGRLFLFPGSETANLRPDEPVDRRCTGLRPQGTPNHADHLRFQPI